MKKILLTMGAIASVITPVVAVVSCGDDNNTGGTGGNAGGSATSVDATKASAAIKAFVGAAGATTGSTVGNDFTDLVDTDLNAAVTTTNNYSFTSEGHAKTGYAVTLTLKAEKASGYNFNGGHVSGAQYTDAGTKITIIAVAAADDATDKLDGIFVEISNSNGTLVKQIENSKAPSPAQNFKSTLEEVIKATGYGVTA